MTFNEVNIVVGLTVSQTAADLFQFSHLHNLGFIVNGPEKEEKIVSVLWSKKAC